MYQSPAEFDSMRIQFHAHACIRSFSLQTNQPNTDALQLMIKIDLLLLRVKIEMNVSI
jgi:hypothetical protein